VLDSLTRVFPTMSATDQPKAAAPDIPGYRILGRLGQGRVASVWKACDDAGRTVAVKTLLVDDRIDTARFIRESRLLAGLDHPNLIGHLASGISGSLLWLALEYVTDDAGQLSLNAEVPSRRGLALVRDAAIGLQQISLLGLLHRNISPGHIRVTAHGVGKLSDFSLARRESAARLTRTGEIIGTPAYLSPEQARGDRALDVRSDIYALGATLFHLITGRPPFIGATPWAVIEQVATTPAPDPRTVLPDMPGQVHAIIRCAMASSPEDRYQQPQALIEDLIQALSGGVPSNAGAIRRRSRAPHPDPPQAAPAPALRPWLGLGAVMAGIVAGLGLSQLLPGPDPSASSALRLAEQENTASGWRAYLADHPIGPGATEAQTLLSLLDDQGGAIEADPLARAIDAARSDLAQMRDQARSVLGSPALSPSTAQSSQSTPRLPPPAAVAAAAQAPSALARDPAPASAGPPGVPGVGVAMSSPETAPPSDDADPHLWAHWAFAHGEVLPAATMSAVASRVMLHVTRPFEGLDGVSCSPRDPKLIVTWDGSTGIWQSLDGGTTLLTRSGSMTDHHPSGHVGYWTADGSRFFIGRLGTHIGEVCSVGPDGITKLDWPISPWDGDSDAYNMPYASRPTYAAEKIMNGDGVLMLGRSAHVQDAPFTLYSSVDRGTTWKDCGSVPDIENMVPTDHGCLLFALRPDSRGEQVSADFGKTWTEFHARFGGGFCSCMQPFCRTRDRVYFLSGSDLFQFSFQGEIMSVAQIESPLQSSSHQDQTDAIAVDPLDQRIIYLVAPRFGLMRSLDGGATWRVLPLPLSPGARPNVSGRTFCALTSGPNPKIVVASLTYLWVIDDTGHPDELFPSDLASAVSRHPQVRP